VVFAVGGGGGAPPPPPVIKHNKLFLSGRFLAIIFSQQEIIETKTSII